MTATGFEKQFVQTSFGTIAYARAGDPAKPPVLFVHGIPTSSYLWRHVMRFLQHDFFCVAPDLMGLGDTDVDPATTPMHMDAQAEMLVEVMAALGHDSFAIVCHDQGGAAAQIIAANLPHKVRALVLTNCVCYDNWPVPVIRRLQRMARLPLLSDALGRTGVSEWVETSTRLSAFRRGVYDPGKLTDDAIREYLRPMRASAAGRARFKRFLLAGDPRYTTVIVDRLRAFTKPTLVIWAADDHYLSPSWGRRLVDDIPGAERLEIVPFCGHFWAEERPAEFASIMGTFLREHLAATETEAPAEPAPKRVALPVVEA